MLEKVVILLISLSTVNAKAGDGRPTDIKPYVPTEMEQICKHQIHMCHEQYTPFASSEIAHPFSPSEIQEKCSMNEFEMCIDDVKGNCSETQMLYIDGIVLGAKYACKEGMKEYSSNYEHLGKSEVHLENGICKDKYMEGVQYYVRNYNKLENTKSPESMEDKDELRADRKDEKKACCGYLHGYLECTESVVERHVDGEMATYQYELLTEVYRPHLEKCSCKIGKGQSQLFYNGIIIVAILLGFIFGLATCCGCMDCCGEKVKKVRRRCRQFCYCCYDFEEDDEYFERKYEAKINALYGEENGAYNETKKLQA